MLSSSNFQFSLFLMSTKSYLKFRTIRGTHQKWVGFGKPLLLACFGMMTDIHCSVGQVCSGHSEGCVCACTTTSSETAVTECEWLYHFCLRGKLPRSIKDLPAVLNKVNA